MTVNTCEIEGRSQRSKHFFVCRPHPNTNDVIILNQVELLLLPTYQLDDYGLFKSERNACVCITYRYKEQK